MSSTLTPNQFDGPAEFAPNQLSTYFLDLEGMLGRIDSATTYYQVLGLDRTDGQDRVKASFQQVLNVLFPPYGISKSLPADLAPRIERAFTKASQAFAVLASFARRKDYDGALLSVANKSQSTSGPLAPRVNPASSGSINAVKVDATPVAAESDHLTLSPVDQQGMVYRESTAVKKGDNRRRCERFKLSIPVRVTGHDRRTGKWNEMAVTLDVSRTGVRIRLRKRVKHGMVLYITLPLPTKLRAHGFSDQGYNVYTLVRRVEPPRQGVSALGLEFIGEHPPAGYLDAPWTVFRPKRWGGNDRRRPDRREQVENVRIEYFDERMRLLANETAKTENVGRYGIRISGTTAPPDVDMVKVMCPRLNFEGIAALRNRYNGKDGLERICVHLIDKEWPSRS